MTKIISFIITLIMLIESVPIAWVPTLTVDAGDKGDNISNYATGFLYGLAEPGVPSEAMTNSLDISTVSQKVVGGLQHPTGDIDRVADQLKNCDYRVVYLQDSFDTWYYCYDEIMEMRKNGKELWVRAFLVVERDSQKGMVIGKGASMIKTIRVESIKEMRKIFDYRVDLDLQVKVNKNWRQKDPVLTRLLK